MKQLHQPIESYTCGQTCLAMILDISLESACLIVGHNHCTNVDELARALNMCGFKNSGKLERVRKNKQFPKLCIIRSKVINGKKGHWMVYSNGVEYDPFPVAYDKTIWKTVSYLEVYD
jgi:hypothetical protein